MSSPRKLRFIFDYDDICIQNYKADTSLIDEHLNFLLFHFDDSKDTLDEKIEHLRMVNKFIKVVESADKIFRGRASWIEYQGLKNYYNQCNTMIFSKFTKAYPELVI